jgi:hypothetical protein
VQLGQDRLEITLRLETSDAERATFVTEFRPRPATGTAWRMHRTRMEAPVCGRTPNNFQMIRKNASQFLAIWGCEEFTVRNTVKRDDGRTLSAEMDNALVWRVRVCSDEALSTMRRRT